MLSVFFDSASCTRRVVDGLRILMEEPVRKKQYVLPCFLFGVLGFFSISSGYCESVKAATPIRDWTMLVYLNGDNNLDSFGTTNLLAMETVGSTANINVVVQWAS